MRMNDLKKAFQRGEISKPMYIDKMHGIHAVLFEYAEFIRQTDIAEIRITDNRVIMATRADGILLACDKDDQRIIPIEILNFDQYEKDNHTMIMNLIDDNHTVFDVGGNIGWYAIAIAKTRKSNVFTFEPIPKTFNYLLKNIELNEIRTIRPFNLGFSDREDELSFYYYPECSGNASLANLSGQDSVKRVTCPVTTLDAFVSEHGVSVDFIKCDVEGAELFVFRGGLNSIRKYKPVIFSELLRKWSAQFKYHPNDVIALLANIGYLCFTVEKEHLRQFTRMDDRTEETNFFFLHAEHHRDKILRYAKEN